MLALKENLAHVLEESQKVRHLLLAVEVRDKLENSLRSSESILPDFHSKGVFKLVSTQFQKLDNGIFVGKADGVRNLVKLERIGLFDELNDLTVVIVKSFSKSDELFAALEFSAEFKELNSHVIVDVKGLRVVS